MVKAVVLSSSQGCTLLWNVTLDFRVGTGAGNNGEVNKYFALLKLDEFDFLFL